MTMSNLREILDVRSGRLSDCLGSVPPLGFKKFFGIHSAMHNSNLLLFVNSNMRIPENSNLLFNGGMNIKEIRRLNLQKLAAEFDTMEEFAAACGYDDGNYCRQLATGHRDMGDKTARKLEKARSKPSGWMDQLHEEKSTYDSNVKPVPIGARPIPVISAIQAGQLKEIADPYTPGAGFAVEYIDESDGYSPWAFALEIEGVSMTPDFLPGDRVIIDPEVAPNPGDFVAARNTREEATFKKYRPRGIDAQGNMIFELVPLNPDYPTMRSDTEHLQVIGTMVEHRKKRRHRK